MKGEELSTRVAGIPCRVLVTSYRVQPALGYAADNDWDARGYTEIEFDVLDQRSRRAKWLEAKLTREDCERISAEIQEAARIDWRYA
jgi:hypothetical protein